MDHKTYIGDAVYAATDDYGRIVLTTDNGYEATNTIILEPEVFRAFLEFAHQIGWMQKETQ